MDYAFQMFQRKLKQNQQKIVTLLTNLETILLNEDLNKKTLNIKSINDICNIYRVDCGPDTPKWVIQLQNLTNKYLKQTTIPAHKLEIYNFIKSNKNEIAIHDWNKGGYDHDLNFEKIYEKYKSESRLTELFDNMIDLLEKMIVEEDLELGNLENKISFLLSVIRSNISKSYSADQSILSYIIYFIKEFLLNMASNIPGLKEFIDAMISTVKLIDSEIVEVSQKTNNEIKEKLKQTNLIGYNSNGKEINSIENELEKKVNKLA